jgi:hypothetical protein
LKKGFGLMARKFLRASTTKPRVAPFDGDPTKFKRGGRRAIGVVITNDTTPFGVLYFFFLRPAPFYSKPLYNYYMPTTNVGEMAFCPVRNAGSLSNPTK